MYPRILVPFDGSEPSRCGLRHAIALAREQRATLVVLNVVCELPLLMAEPGFVNYGDVSDMLMRSGREVVETAARAAQEAGVACETHVIDSGTTTPSDVIVAQAAERHCALIVMGTHGRRGLSRLTMGSDAELVVRQAPVPVMLVKAGPPAAPRAADGA